MSDWIVVVLFLVVLAATAVLVVGVIDWLHATRK